MANKGEIALGDEVTDRYTGVSGTVAALTDWLNAGYLIPPGEPSADWYCEVLNREAEPGVYYVVRTAELPGWTYVKRMRE